MKCRPLSPPPLPLPLVVSALLLLGQVQGWMAGDVSSGFDEFKGSVHSITEKVDNLALTVRDLAKQVMLQQYYAEERLRVDGNSGLKQMRHDGDGAATYYQASHVGKTMFGCHDHSNHRLTVGLGELDAVLNGVEFRTRHNDYPLMQPSTQTTEYDVVETVELPAVPPEVLAQPDVDGQVAEMREYFAAFGAQNSSHRDYRPYFKPVLCYMEGAWTMDKNITEPFQSDRHFVDAESWHDLMEEVRFNSISGMKNILENLAYLPTTIVQVDDDTGAVGYAQWNYRILCRPVLQDLPTKYLQPLDDMGNRLSRKRSWDAQLNSRGARFQIYEHARDKFTHGGLLDDIMYTIPGRDNVISPDAVEDYEEAIFDAANDSEEILLNTFYYHRRYKFDRPGAMGTKEVNRGYSDSHMWVAATHQPRIAPFRRKKCVKKDIEINGRMYYNKEVCDWAYHRYTYAIPLEIIYLTPLFTWNPRNIQYYEDTEDILSSGDDLRDGTQEKPYKGTASKHFYQTPVEFLSGVESTDGTMADTSVYSVWMEGADGNAYAMSASGPKIFTEQIQGVGRVRLRYPIAPVFGEGSPVWKELNAVKQSVVDAGIGDGNTNMYKFQMVSSQSDAVLDHSHELEIHKADFDTLWRGSGVYVTTDVSHGHSHELRIKYDKLIDEFYYNSCDNAAICWDNHAINIIPLQDVSFIKDF